MTGSSAPLKRLPFTHPHYVELDMNCSSLGQLNLFLDAVSSSLQPPATLEYLGFSFYLALEMEPALHAHGVWSELDSLATGPLYARLQKVHVGVMYSNVAEQKRVQAWLPQILPQLSSKGILHVNVY